MRINLRKIRPTHRYSVASLAKAINITKRSIYKKIHLKGLPVCKIDKAFYILGEEYIAFEKEQRLKRKPKKQKNKFWCMTCRKYQMPINKKVSIYDFFDSEKKVNKGTLLLKGVCPCCGKEIFQFNNITNLEKLNETYKIA